MAKTVSLNDFIYSKLASLSGEFTAIAGKPISLGMTVAILLIVYEGSKNLIPEFHKNLEKILKGPIRAPEEFDQYWDNIFKKITRGSN